MTPAINIFAWRRRMSSMLGAVLITALLFGVLVPLSHWLAPTPKVEEMAVVRTEPLPPPPPPEPEKLEVSRDQTQLPNAPKPYGAPIELPALPTGLPVPTGSLTGQVGVESFSLELAPAAEVRVFDVADLDQNPQRIFNPPLVTPYELLRDGITGTVLLEIIISPHGHVKVTRVISADHDRMVKHAKEFAEKCQFSPPMRNGVAVSTNFTIPITFK